jgi:hypothetical protein
MSSATGMKWFSISLTTAGMRFSSGDPPFPEPFLQNLQKTAAATNAAPSNRHAGALSSWMSDNLVTKSHQVD